MFVRQPAVSGSFYPADPSVLEQVVASYIGETAHAAPVTAIVAPHAGYVYSGQVAGSVYARIEVPDTAIVLCPNHTGAGARAAILSAGSFRLPTGEIRIDERVASMLRDGSDLSEDARAHSREHSIEVHLPFLQARNPNVRLVPICLAGLTFEDCDRLGRSIAKVIRAIDEPVLLVASTDMSHYIPAREAAPLDRMAIARLEAIDARGLYRTVVDHDITMCGFIPSTVVLSAATELNASSGSLVRYGHSGETNGDNEHVVGYAGMVLS